MYTNFINLLHQSLYAYVLLHGKLHSHLKVALKLQTSPCRTINLKANVLEY